MKNFKYLAILSVFFMPDAISQSDHTTCNVGVYDSNQKIVDTCVAAITDYEISKSVETNAETNWTELLTYDATTKNNKASINLRFPFKRALLEFSAERSFEGKFGSEEFLNIDGIPSKTKVSSKLSYVFLRSGGTADIDVTDINKLQTSRKAKINELFSDLGKNKCNEKGNEDIICNEIKTEYNQNQKDFRVDIISNKEVVTWSISPEVSYLQTPFSYFNPNKLNKETDETSPGTEKEKHDGFEASLGVVRVSSNMSKWDLRFGYQYGREAGYENTTSNFCIENKEIANVLECSEAYKQSSVKVKKYIPSVTFTKKFDEEGFIKGIQVSIKHFITNTEIREDGTGDSPNNTTISIPIELVSFNESLMGGFKFAYNTHPQSDDLDNFSAGIYLTSPLKIW